jgi:hypothetical protein
MQGKHLAAVCAGSSARTPRTTGPEKRLVSSAVPLPADELVDVRPGDHAVAAAGDAWLRAYAANRDPVLRKMTETELLETGEAAQTRIGVSLDRLAGDNADLSLGDLLAAPGPE